MNDLDDAAAVRDADPQGMLDAVVSMSGHCRDGYAIGRDVSELPSADGLTSIVFCGMGGSAIAGDVVRALYATRVRLPITVVRSPELPAYADHNALIVASSFSGNTAETLALFEEAVERGCRLVVVASGGELAERAERLEVAVVRVPTMPMPRAAFGYLTLGALGALESIGLIPRIQADVDDAARELDSVVAREGPAAPEAGNASKRLALRLEDRVPVIWGADGLAATAASRWKTQFNENAKVPAFSSVLPELDHNEVVGWSAGSGASFAVIALREQGEHHSVSARFPPSLQVAAASGAQVEEIWARGRSPLARLLTLVQTGDLVTTYHAIARGVDPAPIDAIVRLKSVLAEA